MNTFIEVKNEIIVSANNSGLLNYDPNIIINTNYIVSMKAIETKDYRCYDVVMLKGMPIRVCDEKDINKLKKFLRVDS
jgi:hypothetical protein